MTDRQLMQRAAEALGHLQGLCTDAEDGFVEAVTIWTPDIIDDLNARLAHCDRCGKKLGGKGDIHTCTPILAFERIKQFMSKQHCFFLFADDIVTIDKALAQHIDKLALAQPEQEPHIQFMSSDELKPRTPAERKAYLEGVMDGKIYAVRDGLATPPAAASMTEFEEAVAAVDNTLHHAIDHWQDKASEQAALLRECRAALDLLIEKKPALAMLLCGSTTLGNLKASLHDYRVKGKLDDTPPAAQRQWVELTDAELADMHATLMFKLRGCYETKDLYKAIEAKLKEKNT
jgi:hypothetical protein